MRVWTNDTPRCLARNAWVLLGPGVLALAAAGSPFAQQTVPTFQDPVVFDTRVLPYGLAAADLIGIDSWPGIVVADIDMMGGSDLIISSVGTSEPGIYVCYNDGRDHFGLSVYFPTPLPVRGVVARDFDNDGWIDLAAGVDDGEARTDKVYFFFNDQTGFFNPARLLQVDLRAEQGRQARDSDVPRMPGPAQDDEPRFIILGRFPGGSGPAGASDISPEGSVLVGTASHAGFGDFEAIRWTEQGGLVGLGRLVAWGISKGRATSSQGEVAVGWSHSAQGPEAFRWTQKDAMVGLGDLPGGKFNSMAFDVSWDGRVIVGHGRSPDLEAFRWTPDEGLIGLGDLPGGSFWSGATATSADGSLIVGDSSSDRGRTAFRWTQTEGMVELEPSDDWSNMFVRGISADGRVVVGLGVFRGERWEAFRWTQATGFIGLGDLPGGRFQSQAGAVNANGSVIVGASITDEGSEAFIWTRRHGLRNLQDLIVNDLGLDIGDLQLVGAGAISADGRWITGGAWTDDGTEGWVVYLGPGCPADFDGDGDTDAEDFFLYLDLFAAGDLRADIDDDGDIDQDDFFAYLDLFAAGCP